MIKSATTVFFLALAILAGLTANGLCDVYEADYIPWSGYWWPFTRGGLVTGNDYRGTPAPLQKYDLAVSGITNGPATQYGLNSYYDSDAERWEGMCFAWSAAAILEAEPDKPGIYEGTRFRVGDKKGILTAAYNGTLFNLYRFNDPIDFHDILTTFIREQRTPVIIDLGTDGEIWNYPVFRYETSYTTRGSRRHYTTTIYYASDGVRPDYVGSAVARSTYFYYFDLDSNNTVIDSGWEGTSLSEPPVKAAEPFGTSPLNPGLDYATVKAIVGQDDDGYEDNDSLATAALLESGRYTLLGMDADYFRTSLYPNDRVSVQVKVDGSDSVAWRILDTNGDSLFEATDNDRYDLTAVEAEDFFLQVDAPTDGSQPLYELIVRYRLAHRYVLPLDPEGSWANGLALVSAPGSEETESGAERLIVSQWDPSKSLLAARTFAMPAGRRMSGMIDRAPFDLSRQNSGYLGIQADRPLAGLQAAMARGDLMMGANLIDADRAADTLWIPHIARSGGWQTRIGVINTGDQDEVVTFRSYDAGGETVRDYTTELAAGEKREYDMIYFPALTQNSTSMRVWLESGNNALVGYAIYLNPGGQNGRGMVPLPLTACDSLELAHVVDNDIWWTGVALMNRSDYVTEVTCYGRDVEGRALDTATLVLQPHQNRVRFVRDLFNGSNRDGIVSLSMHASSEDALCGFVLYGSTTRQQLAGTPLSGESPDGQMLALPHTPSTSLWWTGLALTNNGNRATEVTIDLYDETSALLGSVTTPLNARQQMVRLMPALFGDEAAASGSYATIRSGNGQPLDGIYLIGSRNGRQVMGDRIPSLGAN
jgi:hypothetical protein